MLSTPLSSVKSRISRAPAGTRSPPSSSVSLFNQLTCKCKDVYSPRTGIAPHTDDKCAHVSTPTEMCHMLGSKGYGTAVSLFIFSIDLHYFFPPCWPSFSRIQQSPFDSPCSHCRANCKAVPTLSAGNCNFDLKSMVDIGLKV